MLEITGQLSNLHLTSEGLSSCHIQPSDNPREVVIVSGPRELIAKLAAHTGQVTITVAAKK